MQGASSSVVDGPGPSATLEIVTSSTSANWVVEVQDETSARLVPLSTERRVVGTSPSADIVLSDATVSSRHCALCVIGGEVVIEDLGSRNGTYVGGARIREASGQMGTVVTVGRSTLVFGSLSDRDATTPPGEPLAGVAGAS